MYVATQKSSTQAGRQQQQHEHHNGHQENHEEGHVELSSTKSRAEHKEQLSEATHVVPVAATVAKESTQLEPEAIRGEVLRHRNPRHHLQHDRGSQGTGQEVQVRVVSDAERRGRDISRSPADSRSSSGHRATVREQHDEWHRATNRLREGLNFKVRLRDCHGLSAATALLGRHTVGFCKSNKSVHFGHSFSFGARRSGFPGWLWTFLGCDFGYRLHTSATDCIQERTHACLVMEALICCYCHVCYIFCVVQDMIFEEYQEAYGHGAIAQVHPVVYSRRLAGLETRYSNKKQQLEDLLNQYELLLQRAGRRKGVMATLWDCCIGGPMPKYKTSDQRAGSQPPRAINVKQVRAGHASRCWISL